MQFKSSDEFLASRCVTVKGIEATELLKVLTIFNPDHVYAGVARTFPIRRAGQVPDHDNGDWMIQISCSLDTHSVDEARRLIDEAIELIEQFEPVEISVNQ